MKKVIITFAFLMIIYPAVVLCNPAFIEFALKNAHEKGFHHCDNAISTIFKSAGGENIRIQTALMPGLKKDFMQMTAAYGVKGDAVFIEVEFRKIGSACLTTETTILTFNRSCTAYLSENSAFKYQAESPDHIWTRNTGGVDMILRPVDNSCVVIFQNSRKF